MHKHQHRHTLGKAVATLAVVITAAGCGTEVEVAPHESDPTSSTDVQVPLVDSRNCADSPGAARAEKRALCVD